MTSMKSIDSMKSMAIWFSLVNSSQVCPTEEQIVPGGHIEVVAFQHIVCTRERCFKYPSNNFRGLGTYGTWTGLYQNMGNLWTYTYISADPGRQQGGARQGIEVVKTRTTTMFFLGIQNSREATTNNQQLTTNNDGVLGRRGGMGEVRSSWQWQQQLEQKNNDFSMFFAWS